MNKGVDRKAVVLQDNSSWQAHGWKYGLSNVTPVTRYTKAFWASGKDWTEYRQNIDKRGGNK